MDVGNNYLKCATGGNHFYFVISPVSLNVRYRVPRVVPPVNYVTGFLSTVKGSINMETNSACYLGKVV